MKKFHHHQHHVVPTQVLPKSLLCLAISTSIFGSTALAQEKTTNTNFELGTVLVVSKRLPVIELGDIGSDQVASVITSKDLLQFNRNNVGDALNLLSGISLSNNSRNEKMISVRGFDPRQVPLFIDGIPVYVPYDGYVDFNRFSTADLAAIQVAKGFSSMAYGPNTLGGAINLISRKPKKIIEADALLGFASGSEKQLSANIGTNQGSWYLQSGVSYLQSDGFPLSSDFIASSTEDGGMRNNASRKDSKVSIKLGLTPNAHDEYAINYYQQNGQKGQPPSTVPAAARYWKWPYWDKDSVYFTSKTSFGDYETFSARLYQDNYGNEVDTYTNDSYTKLKTSGSGSVGTGRSIYDDKTKGASFTLESARLSGQTIRLMGHYKADQHKELDANGTLNTSYEDALASIAIEDNIELNAATLLSLGAGRHTLRPATVYSLGNPYSLPDTKSAQDMQAGLFYTWSNTTRLYATAAKKTRLPTLKDRYSQRLGSFIENPNLQPEKSLNYEIGYQGIYSQAIQTEAAFFYSDVSNKIQTVANVSGIKSQMQNVGLVRVTGLELGIKADLNSQLVVGGNYTITNLNNLSNPATRLTDIPKHKVTAHLLLRAASNLDAMIFVENNSSRWVSNSVELAGFTTSNLKISYKPSKDVVLEAGVNNLSDKNYSLADGFPNPGRMWFGNIQYRF